MTKKSPRCLTLCNRLIGFTLIELLVVIAIIGILAVTLLAAINPFEQIKKSQDQSLQSDAQEFEDAATGYYESHNAFPWDTQLNGGQNCYGGGNTLASVPLSQLAGCINDLIADGDLKQGYENLTTLQQLSANSSNTPEGGTTSVSVCFVPQSISQQEASMTQFNQNGGSGTNCKSQGGQNTCYWCSADASPLSTGAQNPEVSNSPGNQTGSSLPSQAPAPSPTPTPTPSTPVDIITTLYAYPTLPSWSQVESSAPEVTYAIIDVCAPDGSGSGCNGTPADAQNPAWNPTITALKNAGITPLYYISTNYGATAISVIEAEMQNGLRWYHTPSPMFDEMAPSGTCSNGGNSISCQNYYNSLYAFATNQGASAVEYNPGTTYTVTAQDMFGPDEILQVFEGTASNFETTSFPSWMSSYPATEFAATLSQGSGSTIAGDILDAITDKIGNFYEDDEAEPPSYTTLPAFWQQEVSSAHTAR